MTKITQCLVERSRNSPWDFGNKILYDLCRKHPNHTDKAVIVAKIWLIGRAYAAAIERRRTKNSGNDDFYTKEVASAIKRSRIDTWIANATDRDSNFDSPSASVLSAHSELTDLFHRITGLEKRSLASKYLHFHKPNIFYIYDTRAMTAMRMLSHIVGKSNQIDGRFDREYEVFTGRCIRLREHIRRGFGILLSPRQIDNLLLEVQSRNM